MAELEKIKNLPVQSEPQIFQLPTTDGQIIYLVQNEHGELVPIPIIAQNEHGELVQIPAPECVQVQYEVVTNVANEAIASYNVANQNLANDNDDSQQQGQTHAPDVLAIATRGIHMTEEDEQHQNKEEQQPSKDSNVVTPPHYPSDLEFIDGLFTANGQESNNTPVTPPDSPPEIKGTHDSLTTPAPTPSEFIHYV